MKNPIAELHQFNSFQFIKPEDAAEAKSFFCPDPHCPDPEKKLYLRKSSLNKKFFAHKIGKEHEIHPKTLLHKMVVGEFGKIQKFRLPQTLNGKSEIEVDHHRSRIDFQGLENEMPDIHLVGKDGIECFVEVTIGVPVNKKKMETAKKKGIPLIEVNIAKFFNENTESLMNDLDFFLMHAALLVKGTSSKVIYNPWEDIKSKSHVSTTAVIGGAVLLGAAGLATYWGLKK
jgi:hypothetical protein